MFAILTANSKPSISLVASIFPSSVLSFSLSLSFSLRAYLHITSLGYAYLLSTVRNLLDLLRACVSIYPSPTGRSRELCVTECITLSFSLPLRSLSFKRTPLRILACIRAKTHTHTHAQHTSVHAYLSDAVFVAYAFLVHRHPSMRASIHTAVVFFGHSPRLIINGSFLIYLLSSITLSPTRKEERRTMREAQS